VQTFTLANGLPVYLVEKQDLPIVQMIFSFNGGSIYDPVDKPGVAAMTADLMDEGAGKRSALELADEISFLGIQLGAGAGRENVYVSLFSPVSKLQQALPLLGDILMRPTFDEKELDRKRTEGIVRIAQAHDEARIIASTAFNQLVYGTGHPYSTPAGGTEASLKAMRTDDLVQHHKTHIHPNNGYLVIAGAISRAQAEAELGMLLKDWKGGALQSKVIPDAPKPKGVQVYLIDKPGAAQSELRFGHPGVARNTPDYFPLEVMNTQHQYPRSAWVCLRSRIGIRHASRKRSFPGILLRTDRCQRQGYRRVFQGIQRNQGYQTRRVGQSPQLPGPWLSLQLRIY
jgi:predicted Zn-dependent peptidase